MSSAAQPTSPRLRPASLDDYEAIARLESANAVFSLSPDDWRNLWLKNPLWPRVGKDWPIGWILEDAAGRMVGSLVNFPSLYHFRGRELICANGRGWVVAPEYRGFALWLMEEYFNQPRADLFINTTVGANAAPALGTLSDRVPVGDLQAVAYWVTAYRGFAKKALPKLHLPLAGLLAYPAAAALRLKEALLVKSLPPAPASVVVDTTGGFDSRFDAFWTQLVRQNPDKLLGTRDSPALAWHFAAPLRRQRVWILTASRGGLLRAYGILKRQDINDGLRRMQLVDFQTLDPPDDLLTALLQAALRKCAAADIYVLEHLGCGLPKTRIFDQFAPYRRKLPCWPFYYRAADPALHAELAQPEVWDPSTFDGDASID